MSKKKYAVLSASIIILLSVIVTLSNLGWQKNFIGEDSGVSYNFPNSLINLAYYTWDSYIAPGKLNVTTTTSFLWINFIFGLSKLGLSPFMIKRLVYLLFFTISGWGAFFLLTTLIKKYNNTLREKEVYFGAFVASLIYMFSHFTMQLASFPIIPYHLSYMLLPWVLALLVYNLQVKTTFLSIISFSLIFLLLMSGQLSNTFSITLFLLFLGGFFILIVKESQTKPWLFLTVSFLLILLLSSYIYLPIIGVQSNPYGSIGSVEDFLASLNFNSSLTSFLNLFQLAGSVIWSNFPYYSLYTHNPLFIFSSFLIPIFAIASLFIPKGRRVKIFFGLVIVFSLFFAKGSHSPFEKLSLLFYKKIPYFGMYRAVYYKFVFFIVLSYSVLIGFFVSQTFSFFKKYYPKIIKNHYQKIKYVVLSTPFIIGLCALPFFTGRIIQKDFLTIIPEDYRQISKALESDLADFKILSLPPAPRGAGLLLKWSDNNKYVGPHPDIFFLGNSVLDSYWFMAKGLYGLTELDSWVGTKFEDNFKKVLNFLNIFNIRYLFLHKDFVNNYDFGTGAVRIDGRIKAETIESVLRGKTGIEKIKNSPYFTLYKLSDTYCLPHFYIPTTLIYSNGEIEILAQIASLSNFPARPQIYFGREKLGDGKLTQELDRQRQIDSEALSRANEIFLGSEIKNLPMIDGGGVFILSSGPTEEEIFYPYVKHKPGSFIQLLALLKEKYSEWWAGKSLEKLLERKLFYATKRISEIEKFHGELNSEEIEENAALYEEKMEEAIEVVEKFLINRVPLTQKDEEIKNLMAAKIRHYWRSHKDKITKIKGRENWQDIFEELDKEIKPLERKFDPKSLEYEFEIIKKGEYMIYLRKPLKELKNWKIELEGEEIDLEKTKESENEWISLGSRDFEEGVHKLVFFFPEPENLVGNNWQKLPEVEIEENGIKLSPQSLFPNAQDIFFQQTDDWQKDSFYYLSFDYKTESGSLGVEILETKVDYAEEKEKTWLRKIFTRTLRSKETDRWEQLEAIIRTDNNTLGAKIYSYGLADPDRFAEVDLRNLKIFKIDLPKLVFRSTISKASILKSQTPKISFVKINPTKYKVKIEGARDPYTLVFSESYHKGWKAYINQTQNSNLKTQNYGEVIASYFDGEIKEGAHKNIFLDKDTFETWGKKPIPEDHHFLVNGYANSWYVTPKDAGGREDYELIVEFWPQRLFYIGLGISLITLLGCGGYLGFKFAKREVKEGNINEKN